MNYSASAELPLRLHHATDSSVLRVRGIRMIKIMKEVPFNRSIILNEEFFKVFLSYYNCKWIKPRLELLFFQILAHYVYPTKSELNLFNRGFSVPLTKL